VQKCGRALGRATKNVECANIFYLLYFTHMKAVWQSLYVCATKNCCALLTFRENFAPLVQLQDFDKSTLCNCTLWMTHCFGCPGPSPRSCPLCISLVTALYKIYRCSKGMLNIALCIYLERWIPVPLWRNYKMIRKSESLQPWLSESVVTQPWVNPQWQAGAWWQKLRLETSLRTGLHNSESSKGQIDQHKLTAGRKSLFRHSVEEILKEQVIIRSRAFATFSPTEFSQATRKDLAGRMWPAGRILCRPDLGLRFIIAHFANIGDLDEISQWLSRFCKL